MTGKLYNDYVHILMVGASPAVQGQPNKPRNFGRTTPFRSVAATLG